MFHNCLSIPTTRKFQNIFVHNVKTEVLSFTLVLKVELVKFFMDKNFSDGQKLLLADENQKIMSFCTRVKLFKDKVQTYSVYSVD